MNPELEDFEIRNVCDVFALNLAISVSNPNGGKKLYDSQIKGGKIAKFKHPQKSENILANRNSTEMKIISKENLLIRLTLRQKKKTIEHGFPSFFSTNLF